MNRILILTLLLIITGVNTALPTAALSCNETICKLPACRCSSTSIPSNLKLSDTPQFVLLTFDDAVTLRNIDYFRDATKQFKRVNPDGCPAAITYFLSHEYTDYTLVHELYAQGHEIALHSITHSFNQKYWQGASMQMMQDEFADERKTVAKFANIDAADIQGIRMPFLQLAGDTQYEFLGKSNFTYDLSWPTQLQTSPGVWPYTLDYASTQDCVIGNCPVGSHPGVWVIPMLTWRDLEGFPCSMVDACVTIPRNKTAILEFMKNNFYQTYKTNKAPIGIYIHAAWFESNLQIFEAYLEFLDYLSGLKDVYMVGASDVIKWVRNPVLVSKMRSDSWSKCRKPKPIDCRARACPLKKNGREERWFTACMQHCPVSYPWLRNPLGE